MTSIRQLALAQDLPPLPASCSPLGKFAGSKRWLAPMIVSGIHAFLAKHSDSAFCSPFFGGGAIELALGHPRSIYGDTSPDLWNLNKCLAADPSKVSDALEVLGASSSEERFYALREIQRQRASTPIEMFAWAALTIWLPQAAFNGLWRTNRSGQFNVPWNQKTNVCLPDRAHLVQVGETLHGSRFCLADFATTIAVATKGRDLRRMAFYFDPPYGAALKDATIHGAKECVRPIGVEASDVFTSYSGNFTWVDQVRLATTAKDLSAKGALVVASNAWDDKVCDLWRDGFTLLQVAARHSVGAKGERRGVKAEMLAISSGHEWIFDPK